jgi:hypothetical protein
MAPNQPLPNLTHTAVLMTSFTILQTFISSVTFTQCCIEYDHFLHFGSAALDTLLHKMHINTAEDVILVNFVK